MPSYQSFNASPAFVFANANPVPDISPTATVPAIILFFNDFFFINIFSPSIQLLLDYSVNNSSKKSTASSSISLLFFFFFFFFFFLYFFFFIIFFFLLNFFCFFFFIHIIFK